MKIGFFKILGLVGLLAEELTKAASDNRITVDEAILIVRRICEQLGINFDESGIDVTLN